MFFCHFCVSEHRKAPTQPLLVAAQETSVTVLRVRCQSVVSDRHRLQLTFWLTLSRTRVWRCITVCAGIGFGSRARTTINKATVDLAAAQIPTCWKRQCGSSCWSLGIAVTVETADSTMTRRPNRKVERRIIRLRRELEACICPRNKAARHSEGTDEVHEPELPTLAAEAV